MYGYHAFPPFRNKALLRLLGDFKLLYMMYFAELFYFFLTVGVPDLWMHKNGPFFEGFVYRVLGTFHLNISPLPSTRNGHKGRNYDAEIASVWCLLNWKRMQFLLKIHTSNALYLNDT